MPAHDGPGGERVRVFDTTLRDGEQSPGATLTSHEKLEVARALARLGVDVIETGFPAASPDDLEAVRTIAAEVGQAPPGAGAGDGAEEPPVICALARAATGDIEKAWEAVRPAARPRIHTFIATSPLHMEHKLRLTPGQVLERVTAMVGLARSLCADVEFSAEDASRSTPAFLHEVFARAIAAGATTLNIPDTVGYAMPEEMAALVAGIRAQVPGAAGVTLSVHCHDDLGLAVANTLAGVRAGARQVEVTVNGIGERAGNAALEEVVMALRTRHALLGLDTGVDASQIARVSRLVSSRTGVPVQPNKAVVGANAFAHESGIHQDGMLKHAGTYEIMRPETVGVGATRLVLGKHSGRHALGVKLAELGYTLRGAELDEAFARFKALCDKKKQITGADLEALVKDQSGRPHEPFTLEGLVVSCGTQGMPTATVRVRGPDGTVHTRAAVGTGPVDATYKAIDEVVNADGRLLEFAVHAVTEGIDALGEVTVRVGTADRQVTPNPQTGGETPKVFHGHGADTDILVASARAYLAALNKLVVARGVQGARRVAGTAGVRRAAARKTG
ncbi:MAG TPA: 2-isopropylmalate synthase [Polyangia bacterium]